jgi:hypothetical protein
VERAFHGFANPARQVDVRCVGDDRVGILADADDAVERILAFSACS